MVRAGSETRESFEKKSAIDNLAQVRVARTYSGHGGVFPSRFSTNRRYIDAVRALVGQATFA